MNDDQFRKILDDLGLCWRGYRKVRKGVIKRLVRHMQQTGIRDSDEYLESIRSRPDVRGEVGRLATVSISRFFRDHSLWTYIEKKIIPDILSRDPSYVRVWSAGCALGQEAYSFSILWSFMNESNSSLPPLSLLATDMNQEYLDTAFAGVFEKHIIKEIPKDFTDRFIRYENGRVVLTDPIRNRITWQFHDLTCSPPPDREFHIIFVRNSLLTYYRDEIQKTGLKRIIDSLAADGYLIIGASEKLPADCPDLLKVRDCSGVFRKT